MPCTVLKGFDGNELRVKPVGIMCARGRARRKCKCGRPSDRLCDGLKEIRRLGQPLPAKVGGRLVDVGFRVSHHVLVFTCDRPMCASCATHVAPDVDYCGPCLDRLVKEFS